MASSPVVWLTPFHVAEWTHAVEQQVFRRVASRTEADQSYERFQQHRESSLWVEVALPESASTFAPNWPAVTEPTWACGLSILCTSLRRLS
jgi:hypothetical protein